MLDTILLFSILGFIKDNISADSLGTTTLATILMLVSLVISRIVYLQTPETTTCQTRSLYLVSLVVSRIIYLQTPQEPQHQLRFLCQYPWLYQGQYICRLLRNHYMLDTVLIFSILGCIKDNIFADSPGTTTLATILMSVSLVISRIVYLQTPETTTCQT